jgi:hypothetical protein
MIDKIPNKKPEQRFHTGTGSPLIFSVPSVANYLFLA